jgi:hypothetical protein
MEALRKTPEGEGVAEALDVIWDNAPPFHFDPVPVDEWEYVWDIYTRFAEDWELVTRSFADEQHALLVGGEIGAALALHPRQPVGDSRALCSSAGTAPTAPKPAA